MSCVEFEEDLSAFFDGELRPDRAARLTAHLKSCAACNDVLRAYGRTSATLRELDSPPAPVHVTSAAMRTINAGADRKGRNSRRRRLFFELFWLQIGAGALAVAAAALLVLFIYRGENRGIEVQSPITPVPAGAVAAGNFPTIIQFTAADEQFSVVRSSPIFVAPDRQAPRQFALPPGTRIEVIAKSRDGTWAWIATSDGSPAYIAMSDIAHPL